MIAFKLWAPLIISICARLLQVCKSRASYIATYRDKNKHKIRKWKLRSIVNIS